MQSTTLTKAAGQLSSRPADQRYTSLAALDQAVRTRRMQSATATVQTKSLRVLPNGDDTGVVLMGQTGQAASFTHWSFGQLCARVGAPADYLRGLPAGLVADNLNYGVANYTAGEDGERESRLLFGKNGELSVRALTSVHYTRIWDEDVTARLVELERRGPWQPAPASFDGARGLYASDRDMFAFLVDSGRRIFEKSPGGGLSRGFFCWNSEVGAASFGIMTFLYEYVCGNHLVWGASNIKELRVRHVGTADERAWQAFGAELKEYADGSAVEDEAKIVRAQRFILGKDKDEVLDRVFGLRQVALPRITVDAAYQLAEQHADWYGDPKSAWGLANGITELSQRVEHANRRADMDRAAGKLLEMAF